MPRSPRLDFPGARHHVMNRGARHEVILGSGVTNSAFLTILGDLPDRFGVNIHGYALMPNHFHLMLESTRGNLSQAMQHLQARFTQVLNAMHAGWDGPIFRGRFKNQLVEDDAYWRHLLAYLHLNPVAAKLAPWLDQTHWTSHAAYVGDERAPDWLTTHELLDLFGDVENYANYVWELHVGRRQAPPGFDEGALWAPRRSARLPVSPPSPPPNLLSPDEALAQVCAMTGADLDGLREARRGSRGNPPRWLAAWWLEHGAGLAQSEIAQLLWADVPQVSRWCRRVRRAPMGSALEAWASALREGPSPQVEQRAKGKS